MMNKLLNEAKEVESIAADLFDKIRSRFKNVTLGDEKAKATTDPEKARFFNFNYADATGAEFGKVTLSLIDETSLKVHFGASIVNGMDRDQRKEWYQFIYNLKRFAARNLLTLDVRDISKDQLELRDVKQQAKVDDTFDMEDIPVTEGKLRGTALQSTADCDNTRLRIFHTTRVNDDIHGARSRNIDKIFIETSKGERFLLNHKNLHGARAAARHVNEGGDMHDEIGEHINNMVNEMSSMSHFVRATKNRQFEDTETADMAQAATKHYMQIKQDLQHLSNKKYYDRFVESFVPESPVEDEIDVDALRERFVKKMYNEKFDAALPSVYKAYKNYKAEAAVQLGDELSEWANEVTESTWAKPDNNDKVKALAELMKQPLTTGIDGIDATSAIKPIIGDDELNDAIHHYAVDQGPDADIRPLLKTWLGNNMPELLDQIEVGPNNGADDQTNHLKPVSPQMAHPNDEYGASNASIDEPVTDPNVKESIDPLISWLKIAGIRK